MEQPVLCAKPAPSPSPQRSIGTTLALDPRQKASRPRRVHIDESCARITDGALEQSSGVLTGADLAEVVEALIRIVIGPDRDERPFAYDLRDRVVLRVERAGLGMYEDRARRALGCRQVLGAEQHHLARLREAQALAAREAVPVRRNHVSWLLQHAMSDFARTPVLAPLPVVSGAAARNATSILQRPPCIAAHTRCQLARKAALGQRWLAFVRASAGERR